ncbi:MAG TPA: WbqC family protein [Bacteroidales bacterium]|nr:WbqC family protein [Bacteroidales bacterium]
MAGTVLLSTAYFPPAEYFRLITHAGDVRIEKWENYHKQTYRNRCTILGANGPLDLIVPVLRGSFHKTPVRDIEIDNSRRWRELHLRGIMSAYATAPYFEFYFDIIREVITGEFRYLTELNAAALKTVLDALGVDVPVRPTDEFISEGMAEADFRYLITPKIPSGSVENAGISYTQVFSDRYGFVPRLSIIDLLLNNGPETRALLLRPPA